MDILYIVQAAKDYDAIGILANDSDFLNKKTGIVTCHAIPVFHYRPIYCETDYTDLLQGREIFFIPLCLPHNYEMKNASINQHC